MALRGPASVNSPILTVFGGRGKAAAACTGSRFRTYSHASVIAAAPLQIRNARRAMASGMGSSSRVKESIPTSRQFNSTEGERKGLHAGIEKFNFKRAVLDFPFLPDQLIRPVFLHETFTLLIGVSTMILARSGSIEPYPKTHRFPILSRSQNKMQIACVKPEDDFACSVATKPGGTCQRFGSLMLSQRCSGRL